MQRRLFLILATVWLGLSGLSAQSTGTLMPVPQQVFLDSSGNPLSGGLVYTYQAGTTTPLATYSDSALSVPNPNPIVLNSAGRNPDGGIYFAAANYKVVVKTSTGATVYTQDNVAATPYVTVASSFNSTCDVRLTLTTATPVTASDVTAATTLYATPYRGNRCVLYDGSTWNLSTFSEVSLSLGTDAANTNYDVFLYLSSGVMTLERVAWANATTRATAIVSQDGVLVKSGTTSKRYLGTYRTTATIGQTEDSAAKRFVWNYYNRVPRTLRIADSTDTWTYTTSAYRQANGSTANQVAIVVGVAESLLDLRLVAMASNPSVAQVYVTIGEDSTSVAASGALMAQANTASSSLVAMPSAQLTRTPSIGYHFYPWLETSDATGTTTWYGDNGVPASVQTGIVGTIGG